MQNNELNGKALTYFNNHQRKFITTLQHSTYKPYFVATPAPQHSLFKLVKV
jgi:hypothetical protein